MNIGCKHGVARASAAMITVAFSGSIAFAPAAAQTSSPAVSEAVVQPLPPAGVADLSAALQRLARNSQDVSALIDAGNASLKVNDIDAAIGFFGRAEQLSPDNARVKLGLAGAYVRKQRPLDALELFDAAEKAGASATVLAGERGLAYDLVGDNSSAQGYYQQALSRSEDDETRRRLALSHAMAGNRVEFENVLNPLIVKEDFPSYRTRAFGLAILGEEEEAVAIAEAVMPRNLSAQIAPYLRYMPRLTKAQQAAAANLGVFPRAAQIGRDAPQIAQYAGTAAAMQGADARLEPQGKPLGRREDTTSPRRRPDRGRSAVAQEKVEVAKPTKAAQSRDSKNNRTKIVVATPKAVAAPPPVAAKIVNEDPPVQIAKAQPEVATKPPETRDSVNQKPADIAPGFDLAGVSGNPPPPKDTALEKLASANSVTVAAPVQKPAQPAEEPASVADAFANFSLQPTTGPAVASGGVDIRAIKPPREIAREEPAKTEPKPAPKPIVHPKRYWVQIATGRDRSALKFDWRRIGRKVPDLLGDKSAFVTTWVQSNRLLAGPYSSLRDAQKAVSDLKKSGVDSFSYTSPEGEEITPLK